MRDRQLLNEGRRLAQRIRAQPAPQRRPVIKNKGWDQLCLAVYPNAAKTREDSAVEGEAVADCEPLGYILGAYPRSVVSAQGKMGAPAALLAERARICQIYWYPENQARDNVRSKTAPHCRYPNRRDRRQITSIFTWLKPYYIKKAQAVQSRQDSPPCAFTSLRTANRTVESRKVTQIKLAVSIF